MIIACWIVSILISLALIPRARPLFFRVYLIIATLRSVALIVVYVGWRGNPYAVGWAITEPVDMMALVVAGAEASGWWLWLGVYGWTLVAGHYFPRVDVLFQSTFLVRSAITATTAIAIIARAGYTRAISWHQVIMGAFCLIDLISYISICLGATREPTVLIMCGQTACLAAWLALAVNSPKRTNCGV